MARKRSTPKAEAETVSDAQTITGADESLTHLPPGELKPYDRNARTHSKKQIAQIVKSIERFGFTNPVLIDEDGLILAGHGRVAAAKSLKLDQVPCRVVGGLTDAQKRAYVLADNKIALNAGWDDDILSSELELVIAEDVVDLDEIGFSIAEVDMLITDGQSGSTPADDVDDQVPALPQDAVTHAGDVWRLGDHRLVCGDAREDAAYQALMARDQGGVDEAQMVFTDPPYNVRIQGNVTRNSKHGEFAMASGEMSKEAFVTFLSDTLGQAAKHSADGSIHYVCMDWRHLAEMSVAGERAYDEQKNLIVWNKPNAGMGTFYRSAHELIFVFKKGTAPHANGFGLGQNGRYRTNVWTYRGATSPTREARDGLAMHPTVKPVAMVADAMRDCSSRGAIVLDPFCGSGTVFIAAQKTGRRARAIELDPSYCDVAITRWQDFACEDAVLEATGEKFAQVAERRGQSALAQQSVAAKLPPGVVLPDGTMTA